MTRRVIVAGASLGGLRAVERLRAAGWREDITVIGSEPHMPYNRPPLSKSFLRELDPNSDTHSAAREIAASAAFPVRVDPAGIEWRLGRTVTAARLAAREVDLDDGTTLSYDGLVIATGLRPRRLGFTGGDAGRHVLRTAHDAARLRVALAKAGRVVIVGGGFIGCEVAATARQLGCEVTVVEPLPEPMLAALGGGLAAAMRGHHERRGVRFVLGRAVAALREDASGAMAGIELDDGTPIACEVLVEAIGSHPNIEWLAGNGLDLSNGVLCDDRMFVEGCSEVVAVGDVARYRGGLCADPPRRTEHWCAATDTARRAAPGLVAQLDGVTTELGPWPIPTFWTDQFDLRVQGLGVTGAADEYTVLEGSLEQFERGVIVGAWRTGALTGVLAVGVPPAFLRPYRDQVMAASSQTSVTV